MPFPIVGIVGAIGLFMNVGSIFPPLFDVLGKTTYSIFPAKIPDPASLTIMKWRKEIDDDNYHKYMRQNGFTAEWADRFYNANQSLLDTYDIIAAWRRGIINEDTLHKELNKKGYTNEHIQVIKEVSEYFPNASDLIRFAVREVYSPLTRQKFGMDEDFPEDFEREAAKIGMNSEQAKNYWAAHWQLPSAGDGFEMLHRGIISESDLLMLMKALDYMPFWRDKLIQLSYMPLTRVDVRRMFRLGVLDEEGVYKAYLALGYSPDNARLLLEFTKKYESGEDTGITRAAIVSAYKKDIITKDEMKQYLAILDFAPDTIEFWIEMADYEKQQEWIDEQVDDLTARYQVGDINLDQLRIELTKLDVPATFVDTLINKETVKLANKRKLPTRTELTRWLELGIIDEKIFAERMYLLGYKEEDVVSYLQEIALVQDTSKRKYASLAVYQRWLKQDIISEQYFVDTLAEQGYTEQDIMAAYFEAKGGEESAVKETD